MTSQEVEIIINYIDKVHMPDENTFKVTYVEQAFIKKQHINANKKCQSKSQPSNVTLFLNGQ